MNKEITKYDKNSNLIYNKDSLGYEYWYKYDENNNKVNFKRSDGYESWWTYDKNSNLIHYKDFSGSEYWYKSGYDKNGNKILITEQEYKNIEFRKKEKEYNSRTKCSRFELMDI